MLKSEKRVLTTKGKEPIVVVSSMGDFSIDILVRFWCESADYWALKWDATKAIKEALDKDDITIPFPTVIEIQRQEDVVSKKKAA